MTPRRAFEEEQKLRKQEIVSRILKEEAEEEKRKKQRPPTKATHRPTLRGKTWNYISDYCEEKTTAPANTYTLVSKRHTPVEGRWGLRAQVW